MPSLRRGVMANCCALHLDKRKSRPVKGVEGEEPSLGYDVGISVSAGRTFRNVGDSVFCVLTESKGKATYYTPFSKSI